MKKYIRYTITLVRRYVSLTFLCMLVLSTLLWAMIKLDNTYTTDIELTIVLDGEPYEVPCTIEGKGLKLLKYTISNQTMTLELNDVKHRVVRLYDETAPNPKQAPMVKKIRVNQKSIKSLVTSYFSDIKLNSMGDFPDIPIRND